MSATVYRVAVIGLGYFSQFHLAAWAADRRAELVAVCDRDGDRARSVASRTGVAAFEDAAGLLEDRAPDIVDIVAPPETHAALIRAALAPGRLVICQKPFCTTTEEARAVISEAEAAGTRLVIHENFRFQPWHRKVREMIAAGDLGEIYGARFALRPGDGRGPRAYLDRQPFFQKMPRFLIRETGVHFIDLFRFFFGDITEVYAELRRLNPAIAGEDAGVLLMRHDAGPRTMFDGNRLTDHVAENPRLTMGEMTLDCEAGVLSLDGEGRLWLRPHGAQAPQGVDLGRPVDRASFGGGCVAALIGNVLDGLEGRSSIENEAAEYLHVMEACDAAYRSAETGCTVKLPLQTNL